MIACVNLDCEIRWYHLSCVGLDLAERVPNEGWLCPGCQGWHTSALLLQLHFLYKITLACLLAFKLNILKYTSWAWAFCNLTIFLLHSRVSIMGKNHNNGIQTKLAFNTLIIKTLSRCSFDEKFATFNTVACRGWKMWFKNRIQLNL